VATDEYDSKIVKEGYFKSKATFSINDILNDIERLRKKKIELEAENNLKRAAMENIINHYPEVKSLADKMKIAVFLWQEAKGRIDINNENLTAINEVLDNYAKEIDEIAKQTGIKLHKPDINAKGKDICPKI